MTKRLIMSLAFALISFVSIGAAVDTDGNAVTNNTAMGDIDMAATTVGDFIDVITPKQLFIETMIISNMSSKADGEGGGVSTNDVCNIVTNTVPVAGAYGEWEFTPPTWNGMTIGMQRVDYGSGDAGWLCTTNGGLVVGTFGTMYGDTRIEWHNVEFEEGVPYDVVAVRFPAEVNALGLARTKELPQNTPVQQLLLKGEDGKNYSIKINASGSLVVSEVAR